jgi:hypothetical protein
MFSSDAKYRGAKCSAVSSQQCCHASTTLISNKYCAKGGRVHVLKTADTNTFQFKNNTCKEVTNQYLLAGFFKLGSTKHFSRIPSVMDNDAIIITNQLFF